MKSCVIYRTRKSKFRLPVKLLLLFGSRPKSARASPQQCAHGVTVLQTSPKSVQFRRSYSRKCEHRFLSRRVNPIFASKLSTASRKTQISATLQMSVFHSNSLHVRAQRVAIATLRCLHYIWFCGCRLGSTEERCRERDRRC